jgi:integral membrane protein (TIGR00529 family)
VGSLKLIFLEPLTAIIVSFCFLGFLLYKRVNLGITLTATALLLAILALDWRKIPAVLYTTTDYQTLDGRLVISVVLATFGIMFLSQLYKETGLINQLSISLANIVKNPKTILSALPAVIGFLPVSGGALMSAPLVDSEAEKLKLTPEKKAYINLWFRHTIFPVYPVSQVLIITAALTETTIPSIIVRQIPVVIVMIIFGFLVGFWGTPNQKIRGKSEEENKPNSNLKTFLVAFTPILSTIVVTVGLDMTSFELSKQGFDVLIATIIGIIFFVAISKPSLKVFTKPLNGLGIYGVTLAAYGAFLLRNVLKAVGISNIFKAFVSNGSMDVLLLLIVLPGILGFLTGSPQGGIAIGASIVAGILPSSNGKPFSPSTAALLYMSAYMGYVIAPTHLCFTFTADYFKCSLSKIYKYLIPSFVITMAATLLVYFLV